MSKSFLSIVAVLLLWPSWVVAAEASGVSVHDGYVRLPPPGSPAAAYFTLKNSGPDRALVDAECSCAGMTMIHESFEKDGMAKMRHVDSAALPAGGELVLKPGGLHVMLMRLQTPVKAGNQLPLKLIFADGDSLTITLPVEAR